MTALIGGGADQARSAAANHARDVLLRCWLRETGHTVTTDGTATVPLPGTGRTLTVQVVRRSPSGAHHLGEVTDESGRLLDLPEVADLLSREAASRAGLAATHAEDARARIIESAVRLEAYAVARTTETAAPDLPRWLRAEQDLLTGHPWHPMTKSRDGLDDDLDTRFAPETRGHFPVHWFAAAPEVAAWDGAGAFGGDGVPALMRALAGPAADLAPPNHLLVPAHPWQAADLPSRSAVAELLERGLLRDLGPAGDPWWATSSLRTVARPGAAVMLKLSLGLRITNSRRENTRAEGRLAVRTARLVQAGLGDALAAAHPGFGLVLDRGWLGVDGPGHLGLETVLRDVPFADQEDVACAGALVDPRPDLPRPPVAVLVDRVAAAHGLPVREAAVLWFRRWVEVVAQPLLWLHGTWGIGLESHLQNVLVGLGTDGLPKHGWYRDNQGWYAAASKVARLERLLPGVGDEVPLVFGDDLVTDRIAYYLGVNNLFGVAAAVAAAVPVPEEELLRVLAAALRAHATGPEPSSVAGLLLHAVTLPVKANLLTGVDGRDEVHAPVESQSVYVDLPNPLIEVTR